jgi:predicted transcriptional regulator
MCVKPDGTLSPSAEMILKVCEKPATIDEMAQATGLRSFRIKTSIRELTGAGLLEEQDDRFALTPAGAAKLKGPSG